MIHLLVILKPMKIGKINPGILNKYVFEPLQKLAQRPETILRPKLGEDCAVLEIQDQILLSVDPITGAASDVGYLAVHINANDIAASGGEPVGIMLTVLLPPYAGEDMLDEIMSGVLRAAAETGIDLLGGHTEVTGAVTRPVVSAAIIGRAKKAIATSSAMPGDELIMTKFAGLEGTIIIVRERTELAKKLDIYEAVIARAAEISIQREAAIAVEFGVTAMHDITEGGVLGACYEMAQSSGNGVFLSLDDVPVLEETHILCNELGLDPYKLVSSGSLLAATRDGKALAMRLNKAGIPAKVIGRITEGGKIYRIGATEYELPEPQSDEIYKMTPE